MPGTTRTAFETGAAWASTAIGTTASAVGATTAAIRTSAAAAITVASATAERPLKARTRIAANTRGVAGEIFARGRWAADARRTRLARQKDGVVFDNCRAFGDGFSRSGRHFMFGRLRLGMFVVGMLMAGLFIGEMSVLFFVIMSSVNGVVFGVFLGHVRGEFRAVGGAPGFHFLDFFFREFGYFRSRGFFSFFRWLFRFFFVEFGAADDGVGFRFFGGFFVLGFDKAGGESGNLVVVQLRIIASRFRAIASGILRGLDGCSASGSLFRGLRGILRRVYFGFRAGIGEEPAG